MRRSIWGCIVCVLGLSIPLIADSGLHSRLLIGAYAGYAVGFGDAFADYEDAESKSSSGPDLNFGANIHYGLSDRLMIGGEFYLQRYTVKNEFKTGNLLGNRNYSNSSLETAFLFSTLYQMSKMDRGMLLLDAGAGFYSYSNGTDLGLFGGFLASRRIGSNLSLFVSPRLHFVFSDKTISMLQLTVGLQLWPGGGGTSTP